MCVWLTSLQEEVFHDKPMNENDSMSRDFWLRGEGRWGACIFSVLSKILFEMPEGGP